MSQFPNHGDHIPDWERADTDEWDSGVFVTAHYRCAVEGCDKRRYQKERHAQVRLANFSPTDEVSVEEDADG
jgi:hypothetical protein